MDDDLTLLREYARGNSEDAFAVLVSRHVSLVYSVALRQVRDPSLAEEITQAAFIILARKAHSLGNKTILSGWLCRTARYASANALTIHRRRQRREQEAHMQMIVNETAPEETWTQIAPLLDAAMDKLGKKDHDAVVLRFFENRNFKDVGAALGASEDAAKMRVNRALEKLRKFFGKRGVVSTITIIAGTISANSVHAAPAILANSVTTVALVKGAAASASTLTLIKGALKTMAWAKAKTTIIATAGVLFTGAATVAMYNYANRPIFGITKDWPMLSKDDEIRFEAEGIVTYATSHEWGGKKSSYSDTKRFSVVREGNLWKIRTVTIKEERTGIGGPVTASVDMYYEMGFDGTNIYTLDQQKIPPGPLKNHLFASGRVERSGSPPCMDGWLFYPVWLAYCSTPYFKSLKGTNAVSPLFAPRNIFLNEPSKTKRLPAQWNTQDKNFMKDVSWFSDGTVEATYPDGKTRVEKQRAPYNFPFLYGSFENVLWTNWNGTSVPASFKLIVYGPSYQETPGAKPSFVTAYTITGALETLTQTENFSPIPELITTTAIVDLRKKLRTQIDGQSGYLSSNGWSYADAIRQP